MIGFVVVIYSAANGPLTRYVQCGLRMRWECQARFRRHRLQRKSLFSDPGMHHGTCVTHVPWRMSGLLTRGGGKNVPGIPGACATRNFMYLVRGPWIYVIYSPKVIHIWNILNADEVKSGYRPDTGGATVHGQSESSITPPTTTATSPTHPS